MSRVSNAIKLLPSAPSKLCWAGTFFDYSTAVYPICRSAREREYNAAFLH